jgi:hypothetical protein
VNLGGDVAFPSLVTGGIASEGVFLGTLSGLADIALEGETAPGTGGDLYRAPFEARAVPSFGGEVVFQAPYGLIVAGTDGIFRGTAGADTAVALEGDSAPGTGGGAYENFGPPRTNGLGEIVFRSTISGGTSTMGIFVVDSGGVQRAAALQGDAAPGVSGATFSSFEFAPWLEDDGDVAFSAALSSGGFGIFAETKGHLEKVAVAGDLAPGTGGGTFSVLAPETSLSRIGRVVFQSGVAGGTVTSGLFSAEPELLPVVYRESYDGEVSFPTTPEVDLLSAGGMLATGFTSTVSLTGMAAHVAIPEPGTIAPGGAAAFIPNDMVSTAGSDVTVRGEFENWARVGADAFAGALVALAPFDSSDELVAQVLITTTAGVSTGELGASERQSGSVIGSSGVPLLPATVAAIEAGTLFTVELILDESQHEIAARLELPGGSLTTPALSLTGAPNRSAASVGQSAVFFGDSGTSFDLDLDHFEVEAEAEAFVPFLNIDLGNTAGVPLATYGAAGGAGAWNEIDSIGIHSLVDVLGVPQSTATLEILSVPTGFTAGAGELKGDHLNPCPASSDWRLEFDGLDDGDYRVLVYAPADGTPTGPIDVNGASISSLPGDPGPGLTQGVSWDWTAAFVSDGMLVIEEASAGGCTGVAGVQIERALPVPEPGVLGLFTGIALLSALKARRGRRLRSGSPCC